MKNRPKRTSKSLKSRKKTGGHAHHHHHHHNHVHIHCIACGKHLDPDVFGEPDGADWMRCDHGTDYPHCLGCADMAKALIAEHDAKDQPVQRAEAWH